MKIKNVQRCALALVLSVGFVLPQMPLASNAAGLAMDLFPVNPVGNVVNSPVPSNPGGNSVQPNPGGNSTVKPLPGSGGNNNNNTTRPASTTPSSTGGKVTMKPATVGAEFSCPLFDNRPHAELISAIDAINKEVSAAPECSGTPSAKTLEENGKVIKDSALAIQGIMQSQDGTTVNPAAVEQTMTAALGAISNIGSIINNNAFLNSKCGRQSMSTGKVLLALNDVINGFSPYALFAVSMNAALAPALPFVIGGVVASAGISAVSKMIDQNTLDMTNPDHRKAVLQNTCQYTKIAAKVRFMQLAQSGKIKTVTQELEKKLDLYKARFAQPTQELSQLLAYRDAKSKVNVAVENQYAADVSDLVAVEAQMGQNNDDLMVCTLATELAQWAKDGKTFPTSAFNNLEAATAQENRAQKLQAASMKALNLTSIKRINETSPKAYEDEASLKTCAQAGRSWVAGVRQAVTMTYSLTTKSRADLETELSASTEYSQWKMQYNRIQTEKVTITRVEKAMEELSKDNSVIDRSELAQRMVTLKAGLFGSRSAWGFGTPPVMAWIDHTKKMHDQAISAMIYDMKELRKGAYSLTMSGRGQAVKVSATGVVYIDPNTEYESAQQASSLATLNQSQLAVGSREHEVACQQLESAWLDWSASIDHLGAIQIFCRMIDPVLDSKMDKDVVKACRGDIQLNGQTLSMPVVEGAQSNLVKKGYRNDASLVYDKMEELDCPMPAVSVMNQ